jgi:hypothetical protein
MDRRVNDRAEVVADINHADNRPRVERDAARQRDRDRVRHDAEVAEVDDVADRGGDSAEVVGDGRRGADLAEVDRRAGLQLNGDRMGGAGAADVDLIDGAVDSICRPPPKALNDWNLK